MPDDTATQLAPLTASAVAHLAHTSVRTVQREAVAGRLTGTKVGRSWRFRYEDVLNWLAGWNVDDEPLTEAQWTAIRRGLAEIERVETVTLEEYERWRTHTDEPGPHDVLISRQRTLASSSSPRLPGS
jgi:excisionase family DNA binding protein